MPPEAYTAAGRGLAHAGVARHGARAPVRGVPRGLFGREAVRRPKASSPIVRGASECSASTSQPDRGSAKRRRQVAAVCRFTLDAAQCDPLSRRPSLFHVAMQQSDAPCCAPMRPGSVRHPTRAAHPRGEDGTMHAPENAPGEAERLELVALEGCRPSASDIPTRWRHAMRACRPRACAGAVFDRPLRIGQDCRSTGGMSP